MRMLEYRQKVMCGYRGFTAKRTKRRAVVHGFIRDFKCVCELCVAQKARDGERERERLCGRR